MPLFRKDLVKKSGVWKSGFKEKDARKVGIRKDLAATCVILFTLAGCGSGSSSDDEPSSTGSSVTSIASSSSLPSSDNQSSSSSVLSSSSFSSSSSSPNIEEQDPPNADAGQSAMLSGTAPHTATFSAEDSFDGDGQIVEYLWQFGDGEQAVGRDQNYTYTQAGTYTVQLTVTDDDGLTDTDTITVTVTAPPQDFPPTAQIQANATSGEAPLSISFSAQGSGDDNAVTSFNWNFGDSSTASGEQVNHTFNAAGIYTVTLTVIDSAQQNDSDTVIITVTEPEINEAPEAVAELSTTSGEAPLSVSFNAQNSTDDTGVVSYLWQFGDGNQSDQAQVNHSYTEAGTFNGSLTVTDAEGLSDSQNFSVVVSEAPSGPTAAELYSDQCAHCHGDNGEGGVGVSLQVERSREVLIAGVARMPSQAGPNCNGLDNCVEAIADYILETFIVDPSTKVGPFACEANTLGSSEVRRLSRVQIKNTVNDIVLAVLPTDHAINVNDMVNEVADALPTDGHSTGYKALDQRVSGFHIEKYLELASVIGQELGRGDRLVYLTGGDCNFADLSCREAVVDTLGERTLRRPLSDSDREFYTEADNAQDLITQLFLSPDFIYHTEIYGDESQVGIVNITAYELANRLSYLFWNSGPDDNLLEAARTGRILSEYETVVDEVFNHTKTEDSLTEFFTQWMRTEDIPLLSDVETGLREFLAADYGTTGDTSFPEDFDFRQYRSDAAEELAHFGRYLTFFAEGTFQDLLTSSLSFAQGDVARAYGVQSWGGDYLNPVQLPANERAGLLTRAAFHLYGNKDSRPILKGARILEDILCEHIPLPDDNASPDGTNVTQDMTTRQRIVEITEQDGTACATCHLTSINPFGFALEDYDGYGRFRDFELIYQPWGAIRDQADVNASSVVNLDNETVAVNGGIELSNALANSEEAAACFARQVFRFGMSRVENVNDDGCMLNSLYEITQDQPLREVFRQIALQPEFRQRRISEGAQ